MTDDARAEAAALDAAREDLERLCREAVGSLRARGVPPVPVVVLRPARLRRVFVAELVDLAWPLVTLLEGRPALFGDGALRPVVRGFAPGPGSGETGSDETGSGGTGSGGLATAAPGSGGLDLPLGRGGPGKASSRDRPVRWDHARLGTRPGSPYLRDPGAPLVTAVAVPSRFVGMPMTGPAGGGLGVAVPTGRLVYPSADRPLHEADEVSWWPLAEELGGAVDRLTEEYRADPWPDPRVR